MVLVSVVIAEPDPVVLLWVVGWQGPGSQSPATLEDGVDAVEVEVGRADDKISTAQTVVTTSLEAGVTESVGNMLVKPVVPSGITVMVS